MYPSNPTSPRSITFLSYINKYILLNICTKISDFLKPLSRPSVLLILAMKSHRPFRLVLLIDCLVLSQNILFPLYVSLKVQGEFWMVRPIILSYSFFWSPAPSQEQQHFSRIPPHLGNRKIFISLQPLVGSDRLLILRVANNLALAPIYISFVFHSPFGLVKCDKPRQFPPPLQSVK